MSLYINKIINFAEKQSPGIYYITVVEDDVSITACVTPAGETNDCYSISKLFTVTALGMLFDEGKLDTNEKIADIFNNVFPENADEKWKDITVHMVLQHRWGIESGFLDIDVEDINSYKDVYGCRNDFLKIIFSRELKNIPGDEECYSDAAYYLLSRVVTEKSGESTYDYLRRKLFNPLGFKEAAWSCCPMGYTMGATGLFIRTSDMVKLGKLYLDKGMYRGRRLLSEEWCSTVFKNGYELRKCNSTGYGKGGMYGQMLYIDPEKNLSVAWLGHDKDDNEKMRDYLNNLE